ncbi:MAG TPA: electron transfer flavoprotein subunit alpha/FixB family protein [Syntrophorhabdaceae bacterium]|nr:electron transfer flavoprotein subunit alpha/FixB family protein [Syntrophorhabdaceae bacterium]
MGKDICVFIECKEGKIRKTSFELLTKGRELTDKLSSNLLAVLIGDNVINLAEDIRPYAEKVIIIDGEVYKDYRWDTYTDALEFITKKYSPFLIIGASTITGKDLFPRLTARIGAAFISDATGIEIIDGELKVKKPIYGGKIISWVSPKSTDKVIITFRPNSFSIEKGNRTDEVIEEKINAVPDKRMHLVNITKGQSEKVDLQEADFIICGGRGMKDPENFKILEEIADIIGARVGASRAVVDSKWRDYEDQIGKSGKTVSPKLYIGCGVSGALHHTMGMDTSKVVVAINKDPNALIFQYADYGIVDDLFNVLPALKEELMAAKKEG